MGERRGPQLGEWVVTRTWYETHPDHRSHRIVVAAAPCYFETEVLADRFAERSRERQGWMSASGADAEVSVARTGARSFVVTGEGLSSEEMAANRERVAGVASALWETRDE